MKKIIRGQFLYSNNYEEYKSFIYNYVIPILGLPIEDNKHKYKFEHLDEVKSKHVPSIYQKDESLFFNAHSKPYFKMELPHSIRIDQDVMAVVRHILDEFFSVSYYRFDDDNVKINVNYIHYAMYKKALSDAVQIGLCKWFTGGRENKLFDFLEQLELWSVKTYEGKRVTLGFVINPEGKSHNIDYLDFLEDDYSAVLSDCVTSIIEIDANARFISYLSATSSSEKAEFSPFTPIRFTETVGRFVRTVDKTKVGLFLLNNGDIIITKRGAVKFVKRNCRWLNFSYQAIRNRFQIAYEASKDSASIADIDQLIEQVYASILDVSFAHTGGIIAVTSHIQELTSNKEKTISDFDHITNKLLVDDLTKRGKEEGLKQKEIDKRLRKRNIVMALIDDKVYKDIDRKLRADLIAMDGACVIDWKGHIHAVGAIIKSDSGSSGGGRSAAAKKLSENNGISAKISTDGYVEIFHNGEVVYVIK